MLSKSDQVSRHSGNHFQTDTSKPSPSLASGRPFRNDCFSQRRLAAVMVTTWSKLWTGDPGLASPGATTECAPCAFAPAGQCQFITQNLEEGWQVSCSLLPWPRLYLYLLWTIHLTMQYRAGAMNPGQPCKSSWNEFRRRDDFSFTALPCSLGTCADQHMGSCQKP